MMFTYGQRVRIHPACDWFMRGVTHGVITSIRHIDGVSFALVRPDTPGLRVPDTLRMRIPFALLLES